MTQICIVEDDRNLNRGLCLALKSDTIQTFSCFDLQSARNILVNHSISLVLLDIQLPDGSGLDFLSEIKSSPNPILVILLTANDTEMDIVMGLECGADDYITKPFSLAILRARVHAQLRRPTVLSKHLWIIDHYHFDFQRMEFFCRDQSITLSKTEQKLLRLLIENQGVTMRRTDLLDRIWTDGADFVDENALSVTVKRLRDKLDAGKYIQTVYGI